MHSPGLHPDLRGTDPVIAACLTPRSSDHDRVGGLSALARSEEALCLRQAMVLAWVKRQDLLPLGYTSFAAFCRERVDWGDSWVRATIRLVESDLDLVKKAVCGDVIPLRVAVRAPGKVKVEDQAAWLLDPRVPDEDPVTTRVHGTDAEIVQRARQIARICMGRTVSTRAVDDFILRCWRDRTPAAALIEAARERPSRPTWDTPLTWDALAGDPAEALLGPWVEPTSLDDAVAALDRIQAVRRGQAVVLARVWVKVCADRTWARLGFRTRTEFAREVLGWSPRTAARKSKLAWGLEWYPEVDAAIREGLDIDRAVDILEWVRPHSVNRWVEVALRVGRQELSRAVEKARADGSGRRVLEQYERAVALADAWAARVPSAGGRVTVALPVEDPAPPADGLRVDVDLPEAARWFVETVRIPPQHGFQRVKERDRYECQNPECRRISLRNEAHHEQMRSLGGSDDPANGLTVCRPCHVRGLHSGEGHVGGIGVRTVEVAPGRFARLWTYPGGRRTLQFLPGWDTVAEA